MQRKGHGDGRPEVGAETKSYFFLMSRDFSKNFQTNVEEVFMKANSYNRIIFYDKYLLAHTYTCMYG